uniref:Uncharacterized protein n=1 Tax=Glossina pallidipes TaxID=7398 RepID=A0A1B0A031_GLOPL
MRWCIVNEYQMLTPEHLTTAAGQPRLEIFPMQGVQRKPVGKSLILTCRPNVPDASLVADLQWKDNLNNTILPKP